MHTLPLTKFKVETITSFSLQLITKVNLFHFINCDNLFGVGNWDSTLNRPQPFTRTTHARARTIYFSFVHSYALQRTVKKLIIKWPRKIVIITTTAIGIR